MTRPPPLPLAVGNGKVDATDSPTFARATTTTTRPTPLPSSGATVTTTRPTPPLSSGVSAPHPPPPPPPSRISTDTARQIPPGPLPLTRPLFRSLRTHVRRPKALSCGCTFRGTDNKCGEKPRGRKRWTTVKTNNGEGQQARKIDNNNKRGRTTDGEAGSSGRVSMARTTTNNGRQQQQRTTARGQQTAPQSTSADGD